MVLGVVTFRNRQSSEVEAVAEAPGSVQAWAQLLGGWVPETGPLSDPALEELIGPSRSMLLGVMAAGPGQGVRELARRTGLARPRSASTHRSCAGPG